MKKILALALCVFTILPLVAENDTISAPKRLKVGVVMAGGGAKGSAHIGALKYIEEMGIPIDFVTGTSMGSIIGGLAALGYSADQMRDIIRGMDWSVYMSNAVERNRMGYQAILDKEQFLLRMPFGDGSLRKMAKSRERLKKENNKDRASILSTLPAGFIEGHQILNLFNNLSVGYQDSLDFNDLPIPFACVTMNLVNGEQNVVRSGNLAQAIRASMAIPGVFAPVVTENNEVLIDGGLINNFPVDVCRAMGADIVIGLEVNQDMKSDYKDINSLPDVLTQLLRYETGNGLKEHREDCDLYIRPSSKGFGSLSFDAKSIDTLIARGYNEASKYHEQFVELKKKIYSTGTSSEVRQKPRAVFAVTDTIQIASMRLTGLEEREAKKLIKPLESLVGKNILSKDIEKAIERYYGLSCFKSITYKILGKEAPYNLVVNFQKSAPHHIGFGLRYDTDASAALLLSAGYNTNKLRGFSVDFRGRLSNSPYAKLTLGFNNGVYTKGNLALTASLIKFPWYYDLGQSSQLTLRKQQIELFLSDAYYKNQSYQIGVKYERFAEREILSIAGLFDQLNFFNGNFLSLYAKYNFDNMNDFFFPTRGVRFNFAGQFTPYIPFVCKNNIYQHDWSNGEGFHFGTVKADIAANIPFSKSVVFVPSGYFYTTLNGEPLGTYNAFVGGEESGRYMEQQLPFIGINHTTYVGDCAGILRADLRVKIIPKLYLSGIFNYLHYSSGIENFFNRESTDVFGAGIKCAYKTILGPVSLTLNWSNLYEKNNFGAYFSFGHYF